MNCKMNYRMNYKNELFFKIFLFLSINKMKQNFKILLLTNPGERVHFPKFGVGLRNYLFENLELEEIDFLIENNWVIADLVGCVL
mgnify:CR=1 FL=1